MRKHRSLGEMISTATFLGCGVFHISIQHGIVRHGAISYAPILGLLRLCFVFLVGSVSPSQI